jgi:predicted nucleic-acid-binding protein
MKEEKSATQTTVAKINNTEIVVVENGEKMVAVKPICEALGIAFEPQFKKLKTDPLLSSTVTLGIMVGADGKEREMFSIPFKFVFGWLFRIDSRNVKEAVRPLVEKYQLECYNALYNHFARQNEFLEARQKAIDAYIEAYDKARSNFKDAEKIMREKKSRLDYVRSVTFQQWVADQSQLSLFPVKEMEG